jgi:hypothetical protein
VLEDWQHRAKQPGPLVRIREDRAPGVCKNDTTWRPYLLAARCPTTNYVKMANPVRAKVQEVARKTKLGGVLNTILDQHGAVVIHGGQTLPVRGMGSGCIISSELRAHLEEGLEGIHH